MHHPTVPIRFSPRPGALQGLLDRAEAGIAQGLLPVEVFSDDEVFQAEMERVFARSWVFVAHESEIPEKGDYVLRRIGLDPVIVSRDEEGRIHVMSNFCRHRGTQVCQSDRGNATHFRCPYHGWTYKNNGDWAGAPHSREAYGGRLDAREWGLLRAPRVGSYQGFIFASLSAEGPDLKEYLGGAAWILDAICGLHPDGMRVVGVPERTQVRADWKTGAENFAGDNYHVDVGHWALEKAEYLAGIQSTNEFANCIELGNGHSFLAHSLEQWFGPAMELWGYPPHVREQFDLSRLDEQQRRMLKEYPPTVGTIFPNLSYIRFLGPAEAGRPPAVYTRFSQWQPLAPGTMELWNWQFAYSFMSEEDARASYAAGQFAFGSAGVFEQDDTAVWEGAPRAARSVWNRQSGLMLNYQQGVGGKVQHAPDPDYTGPGVLHRSGYGEFGQLAFYRHWLQMMRREA